MNNTGRKKTVVMDSSVHFSSPSSSSESTGSRFSINKWQYLDFINKFLNEHKDYLFQLDANALSIAFQYRGREEIKWIGTHEKQASKIAEYKLRAAQFLASKNVEEEFLCSTLQDSKNFSKRMRLSEVIQAIKTLKTDFGEMEPCYYLLRSELEARRFLNGESTCCHKMLSTVKKDYCQWLNGRIRYLFPLSFERGYKLKFEESHPLDSSESDEVETKREREVVYFCDTKKKWVIYTQKVLLKVNDHSHLLTLPIDLGTVALNPKGDSRISYHYVMIPRAVSKDTSRSFKKAADCLNAIYEDFVQRKQDIERLLKRRTTPKQTLRPPPLDLPAIQKKRSTSLTGKLRTPRRLSPSSLTTSAAMLLEKMSPSPTNASVPKASSARELIVARHSSDTLSKASSFHRTSKNRKKKSEEDFSHDVERLIPPMLALLQRSHYEKRIKDYLKTKVCEYKYVFEEQALKALIEQEAARVSEYTTLAESIHHIVKNCRFEEESSDRLNHFQQLKGHNLLNDQKFYAKLTSPDTRRRFLSKRERKNFTEEKVLKLLEAIFHKLYGSGYVEEEFEVRRHPGEHIGWLAQLRVKQLEAGSLEEIQDCLYPMIEGYEWVEQIFSNLFPALHQKVSSESSELSSIGEEIETAIPIKANFASGTKTRVKRTKKHLKLDKSYVITLSNGKNAQNISKVTVTDRMIMDTRGKSWSREFLLKKIEFLEGAPIDLCEYIISYLAERITDE